MSLHLAIQTFFPLHLNFSHNSVFLLFTELNVFFNTIVDFYLMIQTFLHKIAGLCFTLLHSLYN